MSLSALRWRWLRLGTMLRPVWTLSIEVHKSWIYRVSVDKWGFQVNAEGGFIRSASMHNCGILGPCLGVRKGEKQMVI